MDKINEALAPYQPQLDEVKNDPVLKEYVKQKDDDVTATLMYYIHLIEVMENGSHCFLIEEALRRGMIEERNREQMVYVASLLRPQIDGKPTIAKILRWELERMRRG